MLKNIPICLIFSLLILSASIKIAQAKNKVYDTNLKLSEELRKDLDIEVYSWSFGENPVMEFQVDHQGKLGKVDFIKKHNRNNARICFNGLSRLEPFSQAYRDQVHRFECKPYPDLTRKEFLSTKNYTKKYLKQINKKIKSNWLPDQKMSNLNAVISFDIYKDGHVSNIKIVKSSQDEAYDNLAKRTIELSAPFDRLEDKAFVFAKNKEKIPVEYFFGHESFSDNNYWNNRRYDPYWDSYWEYGLGRGWGWRRPAYCRVGNRWSRPSNTFLNSGRNQNTRPQYNLNKGKGPKEPKFSGGVNASGNPKGSGGSKAPRGLKNSSGSKGSMGIAGSRKRR
jgi:TonB family protein